MQFFDQWEQGIEITSSRAFTYHQPHPQSNTLAGFFKRSTFVVGHNASSYVCTKIRTRQSRSMPIDDQLMLLGSSDFGQNLFISIQDTRHIHHLGQT